jgi:hypothetical protein
MTIYRLRMVAVRLTSIPDGFTPTFSGHETFALRSTWLKKAYDLLQVTPDLFLREDAFVQLGVGKNMAQSIRYWGRMCGIFDRLPSNDRYQITPLGHALFNDDDGWDPFLVTPASRWLLHWQMASRPETAFTWYYTFNLLRAGEFTVEQLAAHIMEEVMRRGWRVPSSATLQRDIDCMLHCYVRPSTKELMTAIEDALACPLHALGLIQMLPSDRRYYLVSSLQPDLPDALVAYAVLLQIRAAKRKTIAFSELSYAPTSPGRVFRLAEDGLLERLLHLADLTDGQAYYTDQAGIRQVAWLDPNNTTTLEKLLQRAFANEVSL